MGSRRLSVEPYMHASHHHSRQSSNQSLVSVKQHMHARQSSDRLLVPTQPQAQRSPEGKRLLSQSASFDVSYQKKKNPGARPSRDHSVVSFNSRSSSKPSLAKNTSGTTSHSKPKLAKNTSSVTSLKRNSLADTRKTASGLPRQDTAPPIPEEAPAK